VGHDVDAEPQARAPRDLADGLVERVAVDAAEAYGGILEEAHPVGRGDDTLAAAADGDGLPSARVARVLVRLDDARRDDQVRILGDLLGEGRHALRRGGSEGR